MYPKPFEAHYASQILGLHIPLMADAAQPSAKRARIAADAAPVPPVAAAAAIDLLTPVLSREAFVEADTNKDGGLDCAELLELVAGGLCGQPAAAALVGRFGAADVDRNDDLDPAEFHAALVAVGVSAAEVREWLGLRRSGDRVLVPHGEEGQQPGAGCRVTAAELERLETVRAMAEELPRAVRYAVSLSEPDLRGFLALLREPASVASFAAAADLGALARAVAACDFLGASALPAAAAVWARLLPGAEAAAEVEAKEAFLGVMERTSFGPALWAVVPLDTVGRLAGGIGHEEQGDAHVHTVAGMARAELARRIASLPDMELAMLRAHGDAPVAGPARAELLRRHPQLTPMTNVSIMAAVEAFCKEDVEEDGFGCPTADFRHSPKAEAEYGPVGLWEVAEVTSMGSLFYRCENFNEDVSAWDVRLAEDLSFMFAYASSFNQPLGAWDISRAENLSYIFCEASSFNQPLGAWDISRAENLSGMFFRASSFNQPLRAWAVRPGASRDSMFFNATAFDLPANAPWHT